jgi:cell fate regulator YaaT (PSP1 superfamily)
LESAFEPFPSRTSSFTGMSTATTETKTEPRVEPRFVVRYGYARIVSEFTSRGRDNFPRGCQVLVRTDRGVEAGEVLCAATERTREYLGLTDAKGHIVREMNDQDRAKADELLQREREEFKGCQELVRERKMPMQLVDAEHLFGGERLVFYYLSENRVDFRELVKALAARYRMRIEMRQIGIRDEAKLLADYGDCGKPVCCNTHLR